MSKLPRKVAKIVWIIGNNDENSLNFGKHDEQTADDEVHRSNSLYDHWEGERTEMEVNQTLFSSQMKFK